jgi:hypothetical protein
MAKASLTERHISRSDSQEGHSDPAVYHGIAVVQ